MGLIISICPSFIRVRGIPRWIRSSRLSLGGNELGNVSFGRERRSWSEAHRPLLIPGSTKLVRGEEEGPRGFAEPVSC